MPESTTAPEPAPTPAQALTAHGAWGTAYATSDGPRAVILYLHGMWASPEDSCPLFARAATAHGIVVCPRGNARLADGSHYWAGGHRAIAPRLDAALTEAAALASSAQRDRDASTGDGTLVGFSNGAAFALQVALAEPGRWTGLVLMAMRLSLDPKKLEAAGVRRVLLAAGDLDGARAAMEQEAKRLVAAGFDARYVSLGRVGHSFAPDMDAWMRDALAWVRAPR